MPDVRQSGVPVRTSGRMSRVSFMEPSPADQARRAGLRRMRIVATSLLGLAFVVFVVTNAMAMAIIERTREIGTLRALGTLPSQLTRVLALEGMVLGGVGAVVGALLAFGVAMLLYVVPVEMPPPPGSSRGYLLNVTVDPWLYGLTLVAMVLLAMLASAAVARRTVATPVVEALAHT